MCYLLNWRYIGQKSRAETKWVNETGGRKEGVKKNQCRQGFTNACLSALSSSPALSGMTNDALASIDWEETTRVRGKEIRWGQPTKGSQSHLISKHAGSGGFRFVSGPVAKGALTAWVMLTGSPQRKGVCHAGEMKHVSLSPSTQNKWMPPNLSIGDIPIWGGRGESDGELGLML